MSVIEKVKKLTVEDYLLMPSNGKLLQLIEGEFKMAPAPNLYHQEVSRNIEEIFLDYLKRNPVGKILDAPVDYYIDEFNVVQPDLIFVKKENYRILSEKGITDAPDLIIEIISRGTEDVDKKLKKDIYARAGVKEYWIVDINQKTIEKNILEKGEYKLEKIYTEKDKFIPCSILPDLKLPLSKIFYFDWV